MFSLGFIGHKALWECDSLAHSVSPISHRVMYQCGLQLGADIWIRCRCKLLQFISSILEANKVFHKQLVLSLFWKCVQSGW